MNCVKRWSDLGFYLSEFGLELNVDLRISDSVDLDLDFPLRTFHYVMGDYNSDDLKQSAVVSVCDICDCVTVSSDLMLSTTVLQCVFISMLVICCRRYPLRLLYVSSDLVLSTTVLQCVFISMLVICCRRYPLRLLYVSREVRQQRTSNETLDSTQNSDSCLWRHWSRDRYVYVELSRDQVGGAGHSRDSSSWTYRMSQVSALILFEFDGGKTFQRALLVVETRDCVANQVFSEWQPSWFGCRLIVVI